MGKDTDAAKYANRSRGFALVWEPNTPILDNLEREVEGIRGFMQVGVNSCIRCDLSR